MTKLIVEMEMPKRCINCGVRLKCKRYVCGLRQDIAEDLNPLMGDKDCLIKGVLPDEHGDLIDRSLLCADLAGVILSHSGLGVAEVIARQDAVIAAERKDDGTAAD